ncbi:MFS general substrate transporter [Hortaea werneckii]|nr:MFS general substrate transporter [Hortaea werneckii]
MEEGKNHRREAASSRKQPEASNDPDDPLNWPLSAKITTYGTICLFSFIANVNGSNFTVAVKQLANHFHTDLTHSTFLVGFNVLTFGLALFVAANAWSTQAQSWNSLLGGRMVAGFAAAAADATVPSAVADIFFLEHRGHCMMYFHVALATGIFLGPLINAWIVQLQDWRWSCGFLSIAGGVVFVLAVFFIRESQYQHRGYQYHEGEVPKKRSYVGWLSLTVGFDSRTPVQTFFRTFWDIVRMAFYPPVFWVGCLVGVNIGVTYAVDCYSDYAGEALVTIFVVRNIIALICSFFADEWISGSGTDTATGIAAGIQLAVLAVAVFFYFLSRQILAFTTSYGPVRHSQKRPEDLALVEAG